jgi:hypothetical protein
VSQQYKQLEDRISRMESDLKQLVQLVDKLVDVVAVRTGAVPAEPEAKRGPGRPKKEAQ